MFEIALGEMIGAIAAKAMPVSKAMFDFSWGELIVIGAVALIVIGPKELPAVLRTVGQWTTKIRRMASEFQGQFQEAMREAEMADLKRELDTATEGFGSHFDDPEVTKWEPKPDSKTLFEQAPGTATVPVEPAPTSPAPTSEAAGDGNSAPAQPATEATAHLDQAQPATEATAHPSEATAHPDQAPPTAEPAAPGQLSAAAPTGRASLAPLATEGSDRA
jgi:sec-independent protein translocase protein TatB